MFCGSDPCTINPPKIKKAVRPTRIKKPEKEIQRSNRRLSADELVTMSALQALAPLLDESSTAEYSDYLKYELTPEQRATVWKVRHSSD